jgi:hypothetical protein
MNLKQASIVFIKCFRYWLICLLCKPTARFIKQQIKYAKHFSNERAVFEMREDAGIGSNEGKSIAFKIATCELQMKTSCRLQSVESGAPIVARSHAAGFRASRKRR